MTTLQAVYKSLYQKVLEIYKRKYANFYPHAKELRKFKRLEIIENHLAGESLEKIEVEKIELSPEMQLLTEKIMFEIIDATIMDSANGQYPSLLITGYYNVLYWIYNDVTDIEKWDDG